MKNLDPHVGSTRGAPRWSAGALALGILLVTGAATADTGKCVAAADQAQTLRDEGKYRSARAQMLVCSNDACPAAIRRDCAQWLSDLQNMEPTIVVGAKDGANDITDVTVEMDGELIASRLDGTPIVVDAKEHVFRFQRTGAAPQEQKLMITAGQKNRGIELQFGAPPAAPGLPLPASAQPRDDVGPPPPPKPSRLIPYVVGTVGLAAIGTGAAFWIVGAGEKSDLESSCKPNCAGSDVSSVRTKLVVGDVLTGVGLVGLGVAVYLLVTESSRGHASSRPALAPRPSALRVGAPPVLGGGGVSLGGAF